ncbi:PROTEIN C09E7.6 [Plasmopara halstedii]|uniref:PROTEIN C09E7.6 n=1 Tax=Plasmopara halstedii TaxID=4781 RepID=A0A0P1ALJ6_PLAHL|nr:PROTEIN C09E7.6 [Plasmopara halstedii]CEG42021.1 PROTEIN C09E7.6 [Plasmopara halstedii]|eukprot:XP_024578390.1 PROTEIN C09E7.6 [Plasmopara halstedii]
MDQVAPEVITFITNRSGIDAVEAFKSPGNDQTLAKPFSDSFVFEIDEDKESDNDILGQSSSSTNTILNDVDEDVTTAEDVDDPVFTLEKMVAGQRVCCAMCALHNTRSDEQVFACWQSGSVTSRFIRLRADAGAQRVSPSVESPVLAQSRSPQGGSARDSLNILHEMLSPLHPYVVSDNQKAGLAVTMHDGTPTLPFPESPGTPPTLRDSTAFQIHLDRQDDWQQKEDASSPTCELPAAANIKLSPRLENFRPLSHRSLIVFHSIRNKFMSRKHCVI